MSEGRRATSFERRVLVATLFLCLIPYASLRVYLSGAMHVTDQLYDVPGPTFLAVLVLLGAVVPACGIALVLRRLVADRNRFRLRMLLEAYGALVVIFASTYAVLQTASTTPAFAGMPLVWVGAEAASQAEHLGRLHEVFADGLYLSIVTMTTVGYGDLVPLTLTAKMLSAFQGVLGIGFVGLVLGQYFAVCLHCQGLGERTTQVD